MSMRSLHARIHALHGALLALLLAGCYANNGTTTPSSLSNVSKADVPSIAIAISPDHIQVGQTAVVTWATSGASSCLASSVLSGPLALDNTNGETIGPFNTAGTYSIVISCVGPGGSASTSHTLAVGAVAAPTITMDLEPAVIAPGASAIVTWSTTNATSCTGSGAAGGWQGSQPTSNMAGFYTGAIANTGAYDYVLTCMGFGGSTQATRILTVTPSAPPAPPSVTFAASPTQVSPGQSTTLTWSTTDATSCAASGGTGSSWSGTQPTSSTGTSTGALPTAGSFSFTLTCTGTGGSTAKSVTIVVSSSTTLPSVSVNVEASPAQIASGGSAYLTWSSDNATACLASGSWSGAQAVLGTSVSTGTLTTPGLYSFTLTCTGAGGSASGTALVTVNQPPATVSVLTATPTTVTVGGSILLSWTSTYATSCTASGGTGSDGWSGTEPTTSVGTSVGPITQTGTVVYTLDCTGPGGAGAPQSVSVTVNPTTPIAVSVTAFLALPPTITVGQATTLSWVTVGATACTGIGGTGSDNWTGPLSTENVAWSTGPISTAGTYVYTLSCTGPGGSNTSSVSVNVNNPSPGIPVVTSFAITPTTIQTGQAASLSWTTSGATACTATGGTGSDGWTGTVATSSSGTSTGTIGSAGAYTYTLSCTGPGGTSLSRSVLLTVTSAPSAAAVVSFTATPTVISVGQASSLAWSSSNATACTASGAWSGAQNTSSTGTSTGPINTAGTYTYTLACTGGGGSAGPASVTVVVTPTPTAPPTIVAFAVTPASIQTGQSALLTWVTLGATTCTAGGGTGSWGGTVATSSVGTDTGAINTVGSYTYTLNCTGPGGSSTPSSVVLNVVATPPPPANITVFTALPSTIQTGQSVVLSWVSISATSCAATGGTGTDGWNGTTVSAIGTQNVGPLGTAGSYTYTLTSTGAGGASSPVSVTVDVDSVPPAPIVSAFNIAPTTVQIGGTVTATWSTTNATACVESGGTSGDGWSGTTGAQSTGTSIGPINTLGLALYALTCSGTGGTSLASTATVLVTAAPPAASVTSFTASPSAIQVGQSVSLAWASSNATSCSASGGTGSDGWSGTMPTSSTGTSTGAIGTAGIYTYQLTCTGAGGPSLPALALVTVTALPPPVTITSFTATPVSLQVGQSTSFAWATNGASACSAGGGTGSDGWSGSVGTSGTATPVGPFNTVGVYVYTLICTGPGGISLPSSLEVTVNPATPAATIGSFTATPMTVQAGGGTSLAWTSSNATSCLAGGGTGSDGWSGQMTASSTAFPVSPLNAGPVTYTLTCTGPGGTSAPSVVIVTVNPLITPPPSVTLMANGSNPAQVTPGAAISLSWSSANATSCTASGGWSGSEPTSSNGVTIPSITTPGTYSFTLTCNGAGGSGASTVQVTVALTQTYDCGVPGLSTYALVTPDASVTTSQSGGCVGQCSVSNAASVIDPTPGNFATMTVPLALLGEISLNVTDTATFPAGSEAGFVVSNGVQLLDLSLLGEIQVQTLLNGVVQETAATVGLPDVLQVQAAGLLGVDQYAGYAGFTTTKPFNGVQIVGIAVLSVASQLNVYSACVSH